jgi:hypothetical protein
MGANKHRIRFSKITPSMLLVAGPAHNEEKIEVSNEKKSPMDLVRPKGPFLGTTRGDVEWAMSLLDQEEVPDNRKSKRWILKSRGMDYPPKYVVSARQE